MKRLWLSLLFWFLVPTAAYAATCTPPITFADGAILTAAQLNTNFSTVATCVNTNAVAITQPTYGGTGLNTSASTGTPRVDAGTWTVGSLKLEAIAYASLPTCNAGNTGRMYTVTDKSKGVWICNGSAWSQFDGKIETKWFTGLADLGAQIQAAHDLAAAQGCDSTYGCSIVVEDFPASTTISAVTLTKPTHLTFGCGNYSISATFTVSNTDPVITAPSCAKFTWTGGTTGPVMDWKGTGLYGAKLKGIKISASNTKPVQDVIRIMTPAAYTVISSNQVFEDVEIQCTLGTNGSCRFPIHWDSPNGSDTNNDLFQGKNIRVFNYGGGSGAVIQYVGAGSSATMTIRAGMFSTTVVGAADSIAPVSLGDAAYDTLNEFCTVLAASGGGGKYTCTVGTGPWTTNGTNTRELSEVDGVDIKTATYTVNLFAAGFFVEGTQSHNHRCLFCLADGNQVQGTEAVRLGSYRVAAEGFHFLYGSPNANDIDLDCWNCSGRTSWIGNNGENSTKMISGQGTNVIFSVEGNRFDASTHLTPSLKAIDLTGTGSLTLKANDISGYRTAHKHVTATAASGTLIEVTSAGHGLTTGDKVAIENVTGTTEANGFWTITKIDVDKFTLDNSVYTNAWVSGGDIYVDQLKLNCQLSTNAAGDRGGGCVSLGGNHIVSTNLYPFLPDGWWRSSGGDYNYSPTHASYGGNTQSFGQGPLTMAAKAATPDVRGSENWVTNNAGGATTITAFLNMSTGMKFTVWVNDANTTLGCATTATLKCNGGADLAIATGKIFNCTAYSETVALCHIP